MGTIACLLGFTSRACFGLITARNTTLNQLYNFRSEQHLKFEYLAVFLELQAIQVLGNVYTSQVDVNELTILWRDKFQ